MTKEYWKERCKRVEHRLRQLEKEIIRLKGGRELTDDAIRQHNLRITS